MKYYSLYCTFNLNNQEQHLETNLSQDKNALTPNIAILEKQFQEQKVTDIKFFIKEFEMQEIGLHQIFNAECQDL